MNISIDGDGLQTVARGILGRLLALAEAATLPTLSGNLCTRRRAGEGRRWLRRAGIPVTYRPRADTSAPAVMQRSPGWTLPLPPPTRPWATARLVLSKRIYRCTGSLWQCHMLPSMRRHRLR